MAYAIDLWKIVLDSNCSKETRINIKIGLDELNAKAKAYDQIKVIHDKHIYDFLNMSETECIEKIGDILEDK
ncbi:hypothetical protein [Mammaliicoccus fleurettii]|uniref:hypothetical protein n=1 Tax=Mammaliicoccus fleurettii TaxID=150056 RepID=UPI002DB8C31D|nr:hypothetical protein [Mammaliicoccus fleurettii]MEB7723409.1 hypothetical protein [Mammaliicoccus fleurettii]